MTSTHGILNCFRSNVALRASKPVLAAVPFALLPPVNLLLMLSIAVLAKDPPVPFIADIAMLAVSIKTSVSVAFPLRYELAVSDGDTLSLDHRGSNQSAPKSKSEKTRTDRRILQ